MSRLELRREDVSTLLNWTNRMHAPPTHIMWGGIKWCESIETHFDMERHAFHQPAAFLSRHAHITPSTYVYTTFFSDLVLAKFVAVGKMPWQASLFNHCKLHGHIAIITKPSPQFPVHDVVLVPDLLPIFLYIKSGSGLGTRLIISSVFLRWNCKRWTTYC